MSLRGYIEVMKHLGTTEQQV